MTAKTKAGPQSKPAASLLLLGAAYEAWNAIRATEPDLPAVVITLGAGGRKGERVMGHFAAARWQDTTDKESRTAELFIGGEGLQDGPEALMTTLLHEAAHGLGVERKINTTSRGGRYHNKAFKQLAESVGVRTEYGKKLGWSDSFMTDDALKTYADTIERLGAALTSYRLTDADAPQKPKSNNNVKCVCECEPARIVRVSRKVFELGYIRCGVCYSDFIAEDSNDEQAGEL